MAGRYTVIAPTSFVQRLSLGLCGLLLSLTALAVESSPEMARLAGYTGSDREQVLVREAQKEGEVTLYAGTQINDMRPVIHAFTKKYGVRVNFWRAGTEEILNRVINETRSGQVSADVIEQSSLTMEMLHREGLLQKVESPVFQTLIPAALTPHREWTAVSLDYFVQTYNTNLVEKSELPRRWEDLLDPKWKGRLGIERYNAEWFLAVIKQIGGEQKGVALFKEIVRRNGISVRKGHTLLTKFTASGEVPLALTVYSYMPEQLKKEGQPIDWFFLGGKAIARPHAIGVTRRAPRPAAALLFYEFELTEGQKILASHDFVVTSNAVKNPIKELPLDLINPSEVLDHYKKWDSLYDEVFVK
jgi:iron(III) transport system substrate-binding protein